MEIGQFLAILGASCATIFAGMGSAKGVGIVGQAAAGVVSENPSLFGKLVPLEALPGSQGVYGFLISFIILLKLNIFGGVLADVTTLNGLIILGASLCVGVVGYFSAIHQGRVAAAGVQLVQRSFPKRSCHYHDCFCGNLCSTVFYCFIPCGILFGNMMRYS